MSDPYIGEIRMFAGNFAPVGWLFCDGSLLAISEYDTLFTLIGQTYGGDGQSTFALPDLRSRLPVHRSSTQVVGEQGGAESVTLGLPHLPVHTHAARASSTYGGRATADGSVWSASTHVQYSSAAPDVVLAPTAVLVAGGGQPHDNMPPYLGLNFILSAFGIYPSPT